MANTPLKAKALRAVVALMFLGLLIAGAVPVCRPFAQMTRFDFATRELRPGQSIEEVTAALGPPEIVFDEPMVCISCYPCDPTKQHGRVLFYRRGHSCGFDIGWYFFFDPGGRLIEIEGTGT